MTEISNEFRDSIVILLRWGFQLKCCSPPFTQSFYSQSKLVRGLFYPITSTNVNEISKEPKNATVVSCVCTLLDWKWGLCASRTFHFVKYNSSNNVILYMRWMLDGECWAVNGIKTKEEQLFLKKNISWFSSVTVPPGRNTVWFIYIYMLFWVNEHESQLIHAIMNEIMEWFKFIFFAQFICMRFIHNKMHHAENVNTKSNANSFNFGLSKFGSIQCVSWFLFWKYCKDFQCCIILKYRKLSGNHIRCNYVEIWLFMIWWWCSSLFE